jgi:hypothetical protein
VGRRRLQDNLKTIRLATDARTSWHNAVLCGPVLGAS